MNAGLFIDDTGSPGHKTKSRYLTEDRKSWVGVFFSSEERVEAEKNISECIAALQKKLNVNEFHFCDIFSGNGAFKNVDGNTRIKLFEIFSALYKEYRWPIIVQTINKISLDEHKEFWFQNELIDKFDKNNPSDVALFLLLGRSIRYIKEKKYELPIDIFIDEGKQKPNTYQEIDSLKNIASDSRINYASSKDKILLQVADFAAFCLNRMQMIMTKEERKDIDKRYISIFQNTNFNFINIHPVKANWDNYSVDDYDYYQYLSFSR